MRLTWKGDIPLEYKGKRPQYEAATEVDGVIYALMGWGERWFVIRFPEGGLSARRTKFYPNLAAASAAFEQAVTRTEA